VPHRHHDFADRVAILCFVIFSKKAPSPWKQTCKMNLIEMQIFTLVNFAVLPFWAAMIAAPKNSEVCAKRDARK
jgi:hypothetical protein